jgi:hypothetical protein
MQHYWGPHCAGLLLRYIHYIWYCLLVLLGLNKIVRDNFIFHDDSRNFNRWIFNDSRKLLKVIPVTSSAIYIFYPNDHSMPPHTWPEQLKTKLQMNKIAICKCKDIELKIHQNWQKGGPRWNPLLIIIGKLQISKDLLYCTWSLTGVNLIGFLIEIHNVSPSLTALIIYERCFEWSVGSLYQNQSRKDFKSPFFAIL